MLLEQFAVKFGIPVLPLSARGEPLLPYGMASTDRKTIKGWRKSGRSLALSLGKAVSCLSMDRESAKIMLELGIPLSHASQERGGMLDFFYAASDLPTKLFIAQKRVAFNSGPGYVGEGENLSFDPSPLPEIPAFIFDDSFKLAEGSNMEASS